MITTVARSTTKDVKVWRAASTPINENTERDAAAARNAKLNDGWRKSSVDLHLVPKKKKMSLFLHLFRVEYVFLTFFIQ